MKAKKAVPMALAILALTVAPALAHQPFFEEGDITAGRPWTVKDATVSTAVYAALDARADVDYYAFDGRKGQNILLEMTIPQIAGQELFAPEMALLGPGLPGAALPQRVDLPANAGARLLPALTGPAETFSEPFSRTSYWERQSERVTLPADGRYVVAVWHGAGEVGRYVFVIGDREVRGGDPAFGAKMRAYWTPVEAPADAAPAERKAECGGI
ncbi:MAG: hypothetical protein MUC34_16095 [Anaerolineae bacterium]|jgi:hypothetical protein|nr:hypothetical protein [Anaerolineae bacterium]